MKLIKVWILFVALWKILGSIAHLPFAYDVTAFPGWSSAPTSIEVLMVHYSNAYLGITFLIMGVFLFFTYKNPAKHSLYILLNIVMHLYVYIFNLVSVQMGLNEKLALYVTQVDIIIVIVGLFGYKLMWKSNTVKKK